jgi:uncharacterized protein
LNYAGIIFGREIDYNKERNTIEIYPKLYYDINGKKGVSSAEQLKQYVLNIYQTIMCRGIKGTFVYACNKNLREYLKSHICSYRKPLPFRILREDEIKPYVNSVPLYDISAAAGKFSVLQGSSGVEWIELPPNVTAREGYFVCQVIGESVNQRIPNGSYCLFSKDLGGSRNGKIVLVELTNFQDAEFGSKYTIKEYSSRKEIVDDQWSHSSIVLKPLSDQFFEPIILDDHSQDLNGTCSFFEVFLIELY